MVQYVEGEEIPKYYAFLTGETLVFVTFSFNDLTFLGSEEEDDKRYNELKEEYPNGLYLLKDGKLYHLDENLSVVEDRHPLRQSHNLVKSIHVAVKQ